MIPFQNNMDIIDKIIINYLVKKNEDYELYDEMNNELDRYKILRKLHFSYFINPISQQIFKLIKAFFKDHSKIPGVNEIKEKSELDFYDLINETIDIYFSVNLHEFAPEFVYKYLKGFIMKGQLNQRLVNVMTKIKTEEVSVDNIADVFEYVKTQFSSVDLEFTDSSRGLSLSDPRSHIQHDVNNSPTGFRFLDKLLGGWEPKTLVIFQGRPKIGKTLILGNIAVRAAKQGLNVAIITVELGDRKYIKRLGANLYDIKETLYKAAVSDEHVAIFEKIIKKKQDKYPNLGYVHVKEYPTEGVTSFEIENYVKEVEIREGVIFDLVIIDYLNLLKSSREKDEDMMYKKIKNLAQELRKIAQRNKWCVISATQVKLAYFNADDMDMSATSESSALAATVDSLFGLLSPLSVDSQIPVEGTEIIADRNYIKIKNLANRDGGNMESWAWFLKNMKHFTVNEVIGAEYYTDDLNSVAQHQEITDYVSNVNYTNASAGMNPQQPSSESISSFSTEAQFTGVRDNPDAPNLIVDETIARNNDYEKPKQEDMLKKLTMDDKKTPG